MKQYTNLCIAKFIAAIMVIMGHSFVLSQGIEGSKNFVGYQYFQFFGEIAVSIFFFFSGVLNTKSIIQKKSAKIYFIKRIKRIEIPLFITVVISLFLLGPMLTTFPINLYFLQPGTYVYFLNCLLIPIHNLPGVFLDNIYTSTINGALWTLAVEFLCYIACYFCWRFKFFEKSYLKFTIPVVLLFYFIISYLKMPLLMSAVKAGMYFYIGMLIYTEKDKIYNSYRVAHFLAITSVLVLLIGKNHQAIMLCMPYILWCYCFGDKQSNLKFGIMENSYEVYLIAFPIAQTIITINGGEMNPYYNMIWTIIISLMGSIFLKKASTLFNDIFCYRKAKLFS